MDLTNLLAHRSFRKLGKGNVRLNIMSYPGHNLNARGKSMALIPSDYDPQISIVDDKGNSWE